MASVRYYLDEHIAEAVAKGLRRRGVDVLTLTEAEMLGASDEEHFAFAREEGRAVVPPNDAAARIFRQPRVREYVLPAPLLHQ